jgi:hypothetical protein
MDKSRAKMLLLGSLRLSQQECNAGALLLQDGLSLQRPIENAG